MSWTVCGTIVPYSWAQISSWTVVIVVTRSVAVVVVVSWTVVIVVAWPVAVVVVVSWTIVIVCVWLGSGIRA